MVRRAGQGGARGVGRRARPVQAFMPRRIASPRRISSSRCSCVRSRGSPIARGPAARPSATRSGQGCSISVRTSSTEPSRICARSLREPSEASRSSGRSTSTSSCGASGCRGPARRSPARRSLATRAARAPTRPSRPRGSGPRSRSRAPSAATRSRRKRSPGCGRLGWRCAWSSGMRRPASALIEVVRRRRDDDRRRAGRERGAARPVTSTSSDADAVLCQLEIPDAAVRAAAEQARFLCLNAAPARRIDVEPDLLVVNRLEHEVVGDTRQRSRQSRSEPRARSCSRVGRRWRARLRRRSTPSTERPPAMRSRRACSSRCSRGGRARRRCAVRARPARSPPRGLALSRRCRRPRRSTRSSRS